MHARISNAAFRCRFALFAVGTGRTAEGQRIHVKDPQLPSRESFVSTQYLHAEVIEEQVDAGGVVLARSILAHADVRLAIRTGPSLRADALEAGVLVPARSAVQAWIGRAVVDVDLAGCAGVAVTAVANEGVVQVDATVRTDRIARIAQALVDLRLALQPNEARSAPADESFQLIHARGAVLAWIGGAVVDGVLALLARVTGLAGARVIVDLIDTLAVVPTDLQRAFVDVGLAGRAGPSRMTDALVAEQLVHANAVQARIA